jgi:hypothetical protein
MSSRFVASWMRAVAGVAGIVAVVACGGGGSVGSGGTGAPLGVAQGTVNGFGSVFVDGERFDDRNAPAVEEDSAGHDVAVEARLGHRVQIEFEQDGIARSLHVDGALRGIVSSRDATQFVVLGQTVRVNDDATKGPVTQFGGGYRTLADVAVNDIVDVHGIVVAQGQGSFVQATRVDHAAALPFLKVTGIVSGLAGATFDLGSLRVTTANAVVLPGGAALANGQVVKVLAPAAALSGSTLAASRVRIDRQLPDGHTAVVSGALASLDTSAHTFFVEMQKVDHARANVVPAGATLANGQYVRVRGSLGSDGTLVASQVSVRDGRGNEVEAELHGNIIGFDAASRTFTLRDVVVDASGVTPQGCPSGLSEGLFVEVEGRLSSTTVVATRVRCENPPPDATVEREGTAGNVSASAKTFVLATSGGALDVTWSDRTFFRQVTPDTLDGKRVEVEGVLTGGTLAATKVKLAH